MSIAKEDKLVRGSDLAALSTAFKSHFYSKNEVDTLLSSKFSYIVINSLPTAAATTMGNIYLVPAVNSETNNVKDEFITIRSGNEGSYTYAWEQIGSTSIDLSGYYQKPVNGIPATDLASGVIPDISTNISSDGTSDTKAASPKAVKTYVDAHVTNIAAVSAPNPADGTLLITLTSGDTITVDLNHDHTSYPKYVYCATESDYTSIVNKDSSTLYLIPVTTS